jgi:hypothetical protein
MNVHFPPLAGALVLGFVGVPGLGQALAAPDAGDELYGNPSVLQLKIDLAPPQLEALRKEPKTYVRATVREGGSVFTNVGVRLKGAVGAQLLDRKPSLVVKFDEFEVGQYFHGRDRILLNNALEDPTYLCEAIAGAVYRAAGVPAAKVTFARLDLNGRDAGLYVLAQAPNRDFLSDHFKKTKGNFYEGNESDVTEKLRLDSGNGPKDQSDVRALAGAARESDHGQRLKRLGAVLDLERFTGFLAAEVLTWNRNGYALGRDNYRLYHDPVSDRFVFLPDGLQATFGRPTGPLLPECRGLVARALLETGEGQRLYRERVARLLTNGFRVDALHGRMNELAGRIRPAAAPGGNEAKAFDAALAQLRDTIAQRARFIEEELKKPAK